MKKIVLFLTSAIISLSSYGQDQKQDQNDEYFDYETADVITVRHYNRATNAPDATSIYDKVANDGLTFYLIGAEREDPSYGKYYLIRFYTITGENAALSNDNTIINQSRTQNDNLNYWCIRSSDFNNERCVRKRFGTGLRGLKMMAGVLAVPFKIRPKANGHPADFTGDFTVGGTFGLGIRLSHYKKNYLNFSIAGGLTSVFVDSLTTQGYAKEKGNWSALTGAFAVTFDLGGVQLGAIIGKDFVGGNPGEKWIYNLKPWYSIGIGYQFIKPKEQK